VSTSCAISFIFYFTCIFANSFFIICFDWSCNLLKET